MAEDVIRLAKWRLSDAQNLGFRNRSNGSTRDDPSGTTRL